MVIKHISAKDILFGKKVHKALLTGGTQLPINSCHGLVVLILSLCVVCAVRACVSYLCIIYLFLFLFFKS